MKFKFEDAYDYYVEPKTRKVKNNNEPSLEQILSLAKDLLHKKVDYKNIFGYELKKNDIDCACKWDNKSEVFVCYKKNNNEIVEYRLKSFREFNSDKSIEYMGEIV